MIRPLNAHSIELLRRLVIAHGLNAVLIGSRKVSADLTRAKMRDAQDRRLRMGRRIKAKAMELRT